MPKIIGTLTFLLVSHWVLGQNETTTSKPFNRWSLETNIGQNKALKPFSEGYYSANPNQYFYFSDINHIDLGVRFMLSETFGFKLDGGYDRIQNQTGSGSLSFRNETYRIGLQGVINLGDILRFDRFTKRFGLLAHAGLQVSRFVIDSNRDEDNGGIMLGITPQLKLTSWCALTGDFTYIGNLRQHLTWDGHYSASSNNLSGALIHTGLGLTFYLGEKENHADWYVLPYDEKTVTELETISRENRKRLDDFDKMLQDTDRDGVPDYLDAENNTPNGVTVDAKGRFIDQNHNGTPDELESVYKIEHKTIDGNDTNSETVSNNSSDALRELIAGGYLNVFFDFNKTIPNKASSNTLFHVIRYLKKYPNIQIVLTGYADTSGSEKQNQKLAFTRAQQVKNILVENGIEQNRILVKSDGVDKTVPANSTGFQLARRVAIAIQ